MADAARQMGVSRQTASKWLARSRSGEGLSDRSSRPRRLARLTPPAFEGRVAAVRRELMLAPLGLAAATGVPARTCARIVARRGMPRLADVDRVTGEVRARGPVTRVRYERRRLARPRQGRGPLRRAFGRRILVPAHGVDDFSRAAYAELLSDERKGTCAAFMARCLRFFSGLGVRAERVMTDNGPGYRSGEFDDVLVSEGVRHLCTRPCSLWQNGKVERMNRTLAQEWQHGRAWDSEAGRATALPAFIERYNWKRSHSACGGLPPMSRIVGVNNLLARNN